MPKYKVTITETQEQEQSADEWKQQYDTAVYLKLREQWYDNLDAGIKEPQQYAWQKTTKQVKIERPVFMQEVDEMDMMKVINAVNGINGRGY